MRRPYLLCCQDLKSLRRQQNRCTLNLSIAGNFTPQEIYWAFFAHRRHCPPPSEEWDFLNEILGAVIKFSEYAIRQIQRPDPEHPNWLGFSEGEIWNMWVNALTKVMENTGLPTKVRKDSYLNKKGSPSSFVTLIKELQKHLPEKCRKFTHSDDALAQGIYRARHGK